MARGKAIDTLFLELRARSGRLKSDVDTAMRGVEGRIKKAGQSVSKLGRSLSKNLSAPAAVASAAILKVAGDYEARMNEVNANSRATGDQFLKLQSIAKDIGKDFTLPGTAKDAATAMNILAKNGVQAAEITKDLTGNMIRLAKATGGDYGRAADIATDAQQQFNLKLSDMGLIANQVTAVTLSSKLDIDGYAQAIAQAGAIVADSGVSFEDFNAALAASAFAFKSGSDAGTSFKTFMARLTGLSKQAKEEIKAMGLDFFTSAGKLRPMDKIAQELQDSFKGLSDEAKITKATLIFGSDAKRTATALAKAGSAGILAMRKQLDSITTAEALNKRLQGYNASIEKFKKAVAAAFLAIGESGLLAKATQLFTKLGQAVIKVAELDPKLLQLIATVTAAAVALGPLVVALGFAVTQSAALVPLIAGLATPFGVLTIALAALSPKIISFVKTFDFGPLLDSIKIKVGALADAAKSLLGPAIARLNAFLIPLKASLLELWNAFTALPLPIEAVKGLIEKVSTVFVGMFVVALKAAIEILAEVIGILDLSVKGWTMLFDIIVAITPKIVATVKQLYLGVKTWLQDKLGGVFDFIGNKIKKLNDTFDWLYNSVVGNSIIPDMVKELIDEGKKLTSGFFTPINEDLVEAEANFAKFSNLTIPQLQKKVENLTKIMDSSKIGSKAFQTVNTEIQNIEAAMSKAQQGAQSFGRELSQGERSMFMIEDAGNNMFESLIDGTKSFKEAFKDALADIASNIAKMIATDAFSALFPHNQNGGATGGGGILSAVAGGIGSLLGFANGGRPPVGQASIIGEKGPELFIPDNAGTVLPNGVFNQGGAGQQQITNVHQTFQSGVTRRELANIKGEWKAETIAATNQTKNKGGNFRRKMQ